MRRQLPLCLLCCLAACGRPAGPEVAPLPPSGTAVGVDGADAAAAKRAVLATAYDPSSVHFDSVTEAAVMEVDDSPDHHKTHYLAVQGTWKVKSGRTEPFSVMCQAAETPGGPAKLLMGP